MFRETVLTKGGMALQGDARDFNRCKHILQESSLPAADLLMGSLNQQHRILNLQTYCGGSSWPFPWPSEELQQVEREGGFYPFSYQPWLLKPSMFWFSDSVQVSVNVETQFCVGPAWLNPSSC